MGEMATKERAGRMSAEQVLELWREYKRTDDAGSARPAGSDLRADGEIHRLPQGARDAGPLRGGGLHLLRPGSADPVDRPLRPGKRHAGAVCWTPSTPDLSCGLEALIRSIDRYDPDKGATLEQFAWTRIHGAVLDELRRNDWAPRSLRRWDRELTKARDQFIGLYGRKPSRDELSSAHGRHLEELDRRQDELRALADRLAQRARALRRRRRDRADRHAGRR